MKAEAHGWSLENGTYKIKWYDGDQLPQSILEILMMEILQPLKKQTLIRQQMIKVMCLTMKIMHTSTSAETNVIK